MQSPSLHHTPGVHGSPSDGIFPVHICGAGHLCRGGMSVHGCHDPRRRDAENLCEINYSCYGNSHYQVKNKNPQGLTSSIGYSYLHGRQDFSRTSFGGHFLHPNAKGTQ